MALFKKKPKPLPFDPQTQEPAVRKSICTGEMTLGFVDKETGRFQELQKVDDQELADFCRQVGAEHIRTIY